jgi:hypothetical protein
MLFGGGLFTFSSMSGANNIPVRLGVHYLHLASPVNADAVQQEEWQRRRFNDETKDDPKRQEQNA